MVGNERGSLLTEKIRGFCKPCDFFVPNGVCSQEQVESEAVQERRANIGCCAKAQVEGKEGTMFSDKFVPKERVV